MGTLTLWERAPVRHGPRYQRGLAESFPRNAVSELSRRGPWLEKLDRAGGFSVACAVEVELTLRADTIGDWVPPSSEHALGVGVPCIPPMLRMMTRRKVSSVSSNELMKRAVCRLYDVTQNCTLSSLIM